MSWTIVSIAKLMNAKVLFDNIVKEITIPESPDEIQSIAFLIMEKLYGTDRTRILAQQEISDTQQSILDAIVNRVNTEEPIQYILNEAYFYGRTFFVDASVLIPRTETELLIELVVAEYTHKKNVSILDVGTGSGCIAVTLAKEMPGAEIFAIDVSEEALKTARKNADKLEATVYFDRLNFLEQKTQHKNLTAIVSNPPYIMHAEKNLMRNNVLKYEPHVAMFVPDTDPLIFYKEIAKQGLEALAPEGKIFVEINEQLGKMMCEMFESFGYTKTSIVKDLFGKERIVTASR
jgi:release factor glutamine methyltransferase